MGTATNFNYFMFTSLSLLLSYDFQLFLNWEDSQKDHKLNRTYYLSVIYPPLSYFKLNNLYNVYFYYIQIKCYYYKLELASY